MLEPAVEGEDMSMVDSRREESTKTVGLCSNTEEKGRAGVIVEGMDILGDCSRSMHEA